MKTCGCCKRSLLPKEFSKNKLSKDGLNSKCKTCDSIARTKRRSYLIAEYFDYDRLLEKQDGKCAICNNSDKRLCLDHNHSTGKIRGLLCTRCNRGIGLLGDNVETLKNAIEYLQKEGRDND